MRTGDDDIIGSVTLGFEDMQCSDFKKFVGDADTRIDRL
jgi:hypothetical protein